MINIDFSGFWLFVQNLGSQNPVSIGWYLFVHGGWAVFLILFLWMAKEFWLSHIQDKYDATREFVLLSISIPKMNEQSPKAVEHIFSHLAGAHGSTNFVDKYFEGKTQEVFSLEIISTEGYIQFLIRTNVNFRDLVEASVFAQYPDAEIAEVPDYTEGFPAKFPDDQYDLWGTEFILTEKECYPIRSYVDFEHPLTGEFKDPMAALLENYSHIGKGEHVWFQIILTPIGQKEWKKAGRDEVNKLIGVEVQSKKNMLDKISDAPLKALETAGSIVLSGGDAPTKKEEGKKDPSKMLYLSPGERDVVVGIERKLTKIGYKCKIRAVYIGKKEVFKKTKAAHPLIGAIKQFNTVNLNSFKPEYKKVGTGGVIFFKNYRLNKRKEKIMRAYRSRSNWAGVGEDGFVLNIEELATLFHFPVMEVKAPLLKKTEAKRGEAPFGLPIEESPVPSEEESTIEGDIPDNLPIE